MTTAESRSRHVLYDDPLHYYNDLLFNIQRARKYIYIEVYRFGHDAIGKKIREALRKKLLENVEVKLLVDSWGTANVDPFFSSLKELNAEVRAFSRIKLNLNFFTNSHRRNHQKIIIIDDRISYLGSCNLTGYNLSWRELVLKSTNIDIALALKNVFLQMFHLYNKYLLEKSIYTRPINVAGMTILRDVPSIRRQPVKKKYLRLIRNARKSIIIETPYFLPSFLLRKALMAAAERGVKVTVITPKNSDVKMVDILRNKYLGMLHKKGVSIQYYTPENLHAKLLFVDNTIFSIGSPNFDYRSFRFQHEIIIVGKNKQIVHKLQRHIEGSLENSIAFDYDLWLNRSQIEKFFSWLIVPFRHLL